jgi:hypothetical protein
MKKLLKTLVAVAALTVACGLCVTPAFAGIERIDGSLLVTGDITTGDDITVGDDLTVTGGLDVDGAVTLDAVTLDGTFTVGADDTGYDSTLYGDTSGDYWKYDASENQVNIAYSVDGDSQSRAVEVLTTSGGDQTSGGNVEAFKSEIVSEYMLGDWANAVMAKVDLGDSGEVSGLAGVICAELSMPASDAVAGGEYAVYEAEIDVPDAAAVNGRPINVFEVNAWGSGVAAFDDYGLLFDISGVTKDAGHIFDDCVAPAATHALKCRIGGTNYYLLLTNDVDAS